MSKMFVRTVGDYTNNNEMPFIQLKEGEVVIHLKWSIYVVGFSVQATCVMLSGDPQIPDEISTQLCMQAISHKDFDDLRGSSDMFWAVIGKE